MVLAHQFDTGYRPKAAHSESSHLQRLGFREGFLDRRGRKIRLGLGRLKPKPAANQIAIK